MATQFTTTLPVLDSLDEIVVPLEFEIADIEDIQVGDFILTKMGWWGRVHSVKDCTGGRGYSAYVMEYIGNSNWRPGKTRMWVWDDEVVDVL